MSMGWVRRYYAYNIDGGASYLVTRRPTRHQEIYNSQGVLLFKTGGPNV